MIKTIVISALVLLAAFGNCGHLRNQNTLEPDWKRLAGSAVISRCHGVIRLNTFRRVPHALVSILM
jgi:hypothetical protein